MKVKWPVLLAFVAVVLMWIGIGLGWADNVTMSLGFTAILLCVMEIARD